MSLIEAADGLVLGHERDALDGFDFGHGLGELLHVRARLREDGDFDGSRNLLIYWSKGILREDMREFLIGKLCPDTSISELFKLLSLPFFLNKNPLTATLFRVKRSLLRMLVVS